MLQSFLLRGRKTPNGKSSSQSQPRASFARFCHHPPAEVTNSAVKGQHRDGRAQGGNEPDLGEVLAC